MYTHIFILIFANINVHIKGSFDPTSIYDVTENNGNKTTGFYGIKRFQAFNSWVFNRSESTIIVGGHSLWFKYFFQTYLPHASDHPAKSQKIVNSGVVSFVLHRVDGNDVNPSYRIDPNSVVNIYGGFSAK
jgi:hypothetical protein